MFCNGSKIAFVESSSDFSPYSCYQTWTWWCWRQQSYFHRFPDSHLPPVFKSFWSFRSSHISSIAITAAGFLIVVVELVEAVSLESYQWNFLWVNCCFFRISQRPTSDLPPMELPVPPPPAPGVSVVAATWKDTHFFQLLKTLMMVLVPWWLINK